MSRATVREADPAEAVDVVRVIEGALLEVDPGRVRERAAAGDVLVAEDGDAVVGALVLGGGGDDARVEAVAVAPRHRRRGVGTALVEAAAARHDRLTAAFRPAVRGFWTGLGFEVVERGDRLRAVRE